MNKPDVAISAHVRTLSFTKVQLEALHADVVFGLSADPVLRMFGRRYRISSTKPS